MTGDPRSVTVIGGGIVGLSIALALQRRGLAVTILDRQTGTASASAGNAGHIAIEQHEPLSSVATLRSLPRRLMSVGGPVSLPPQALHHWLPFGLRLLGAARPSRFVRGTAALSALLGEALPAWRRLMADAGTPDLLRDTGHIVAWTTPEAARRGRAGLQGFASPLARWRDLEGVEAVLLAGQLKAAPADAVRFEGSASVADPALVLATLGSLFLERGGTVEKRGSTLEEARRLGADLIVVAAGIGSAPIMRALGHRVPLIAERGYHIQSAETRWPTALPPVVFEDRAMVVTRFRSGLRATSFTEFTHADTAPDPRKWARLERQARMLGLPFDAPVETWVGSRPTLPDYLPAIGRSRRDPRVVYAFGHQHLGLTLGPMTGESVAALVAGEPASVDLAPFDLGRFG